MFAPPQRQLLLHECKAGKIVTGALGRKLTALNSICRHVSVLIQEQNEVLLRGYILNTYRTWHYGTYIIDVYLWHGDPFQVRRLLRDACLRGTS
jgi:hypothetical protein